VAIKKWPRQCVLDLLFGPVQLQLKMQSQEGEGTFKRLHLRPRNLALVVVVVVVVVEAVEANSNSNNEVLDRVQVLLYGAQLGLCSGWFEQFCARASFWNPLPRHTHTHLLC
jgi:hypothetical protein